MSIVDWLVLGITLALIVGYGTWKTRNGWRKLLLGHTAITTANSTNPEGCYQKREGAKNEFRPL